MNGVPRRWSWSWVWPLAASVWSACNVGQPLVDVVPQFEGGVRSRCLEPAECIEVDPPGSESWAERGRVKRVDLTSCERGGVLDCAEDDRQGCSEARGLGALRSLSGLRRECTSLRFEIEAGPTEPLVLEGVALRRVNLHLESDAAVQVELHGPLLRDVWISLSGPVTLRVVEVEGGEALQVAGRRTLAGAPRLELERVDARGLQIGDIDAPFEGVVSLVRSAWTDAQVVVRELNLESVTYANGRIDAERLLALDSEIENSPLSLGEGQLVSCRLKRTRIDSCALLTLLGTEMGRSHIAACASGPLRVFDSELAGCSVDGTVFADRSLFTSVAFGVSAPTELRTWEGSLGTSQLCAHARRYQAMRGVVSCSVCEAALSEPHAACAPNGLAPTFLDNTCEAWESIEACRDPAPRERPVMEAL